MKQLILILGPTASGKTDYAIRTAQSLHTEIISFDSRQFYTQLNIGVARPTPDELAAVKHHFIACRSVETPYNVYDYATDALHTIQQLHQHHDTVVAVGGSGLYADALTHGINQLPDPTPQLRQQLSQQIAHGQLPQLLEQLRQLDPDYYKTVDHNNPIRIQRALEVTLTSGTPYSQLINQPLPPRPFAVRKIALLRQRDDLRQRIHSRVDLMLRNGLLDEVRTLLPYRNLNTLNTVGYKELFDYLDGNTTLDHAILAIKNNTWHYAKKQLTWLKRYHDIEYIDV